MPGLISSCICIYIVYTCLVRDAEGKKNEASKVKQTTIKAKQHSTPKAVTFPKKNELPRVGLCMYSMHSPVGSVDSH